MLLHSFFCVGESAVGSALCETLPVSTSNGDECGGMSIHVDEDELFVREDIASYFRDAEGSPKQSGRRAVAISSLTHRSICCLQTLS
jgi:hypothetical protein